MDKYITLNHNEFHYVEMGTGESTCLLLHGMRDNAEVWEEVGKFLCNSYRIIALNLRAHGKTKKPTSASALTLEMFQRDLVEFVEALELRDLTIIAHSFGASLAIGYTLICQDKIKKLVLVGCGKGTREDNQRKHFKPPEDIKDPKEIQAVMLPRFFPLNRKTVTPKTIDAIQARIVAGWDNLHQNKFIHKQLLFLGRPDFESDYSRLNIPVLLIFGELDQVAPPSNGEYLHQQIPDSRLVIMKDCGHYMFLEKIEDFCEVVTRFIG